MPASFEAAGRPTHTVPLPPRVAHAREPPAVPPGAAPTWNPGLGFSSHLIANGVTSAFRSMRTCNPLTPHYEPLEGAGGGLTSRSSLATFGAPLTNRRGLVRDPLNTADIEG